MECLAGIAPANLLLRPSHFCSYNTRKAFRLNANFNPARPEEEDPLLRFATTRASLRFKETISSGNFNCPLSFSLHSFIYLKYFWFRHFLKQLLGVSNCNFHLMLL